MKFFKLNRLTNNHFFYQAIFLAVVIMSSNVCAQSIPASQQIIANALSKPPCHPDVLAWEESMGISPNTAWEKVVWKGRDVLREKESGIYSEVKNDIRIELFVEDYKNNYLTSKIGYTLEWKTPEESIKFSQSLMKDGNVKFLLWEKPKNTFYEDKYTYYNERIKYKPTKDNGIHIYHTVGYRKVNTSDKELVKRLNKALKQYGYEKIKSNSEVWVLRTFEWSVWYHYKIEEIYHHPCQFTARDEATTAWKSAFTAKVEALSNEEKTQWGVPTDKTALDSWVNELFNDLPNRLAFQVYIQNGKPLMFDGKPVYERTHGRKEFESKPQLRDTKNMLYNNKYYYNGEVSNEVVHGKGAIRHHYHRVPKFQWKGDFFMGFAHGIVYKYNKESGEVPVRYQFGKVKEEKMSFPKEGYTLEAVSLDGKTIVDGVAEEVYPDGRRVQVLYENQERKEVQGVIYPSGDHFIGPVNEKGYPHGEGKYHYNPDAPHQLKYFTTEWKNGKPTADKVEIKTDGFVWILAPLDENFLPHSPELNSVEFWYSKEKKNSGRKGTAAYEHGIPSIAHIKYPYRYSQNYAVPHSYKGEVNVELKPHGEGKLTVNEGEYKNTWTGTFKDGKKVKDKGSWKHKPFERTYAEREKNYDKLMDNANSLAELHYKMSSDVGKSQGVKKAYKNSEIITLRGVGNGFSILVYDLSKNSKKITFEVLDVEVREGYKKTGEKLTFGQDLAISHNEQGIPYTILKVKEKGLNRFTEIKMKFTSDWSGAEQLYYEVID